MNENLSGNILSGLEGIVTVAGVNNQTCIITGDKKQKKYNLTYEPIEINSIKAYFLVHLTFEDGTVNTYFLPMQFLGVQSVVFEVPFQVATMQFYIYGNLKLKDTSLKSVITDALTEEQKEALNKVTTNSEYWDRILAITNNLGNVITEKLEGSINTAINTITNSSGQMYWEDGKFICRDGATDAGSTMAMMISPGGFMIADSKKPNGDWDWRTFGTGKGFTADEIIAGTLEAIAIRGVTITGSVITGGEVIGAIIKGGSLNINDRFIVDSDGDVQMSGAITWGADNSPVKVKYSSDNSNWHYDYQSGDTFAKYSYDGGLTWTSGIKIAGVDGAPGLPGENGGSGADGITYYSWIKYADDDKGNGISDYPVGKKYIGMAYNKTSHNETNEPTDYTWSKFVGEDGLDGTDGIPGKNGTDGKTYYTWIKYADTSTGEGMSNTSTGKKYIGIAYNKSTATESNVASDYTWSLIKGDKGDTGATGPQGPAGSDANVPSFIHGTYIDSVEIKSPTITGNVVNAATITGGTISGTTITGSTITGNTVFADQAVVSGLEVGKNVNMGSNATIAWGSVSGKPNTTKIDANGIYTGTINAGNISGGTISGVNITANKQFRVANTYGTTIFNVQNFGGSDDGILCYGPLKSNNCIYAPKLWGSSGGYYIDYNKFCIGNIPNGTQPNNPNVEVNSNGYIYGKSGGSLRYQLGTASQGSLSLYQGGEYLRLNRNGSGYAEFYGNGTAFLWGSSNTRVGTSSTTTYIQGRAEVAGQLSAKGGLATTGTKNAIVHTQNHGKRLLYCEESDRLYFNTKGIAETHLTSDDKYQYIIRLDDIFFETIEPNSKCPYIVNLTPYARGMIWVKEVYDRYIIVESDEPIRFAYNVQCTRVGYKDTYLEEFESGGSNG